MYHMVESYSFGPRVVASTIFVRLVPLNRLVDRYGKVFRDINSWNESNSFLFRQVAQSLQRRDDYRLPAGEARHALPRPHGFEYFLGSASSLDLGSMFSNAIRKAISLSRDRPDTTVAIIVPPDATVTAHLKHTNGTIKVSHTANIIGTRFMLAKPSLTDGIKVLPETFAKHHRWPPRGTLRGNLRACLATHAADFSAQRFPRTEG